MASILWADVTAWAPTLSTVHATVQADAVALANAAFDPDAWADGGEASLALRMARILYAAHLATTAKTASGAAGPVTSQSVGGISKSYGTLPSTSELGTTAYGRQLVSLLRPRFGGPRVI